MRQMERDKAALEGQLKDLEWRLDNESKVRYKINTVSIYSFANVHYGDT